MKYGIKVYTRNSPEGLWCLPLSNSICYSLNEAYQKLPKWAGTDETIKMQNGYGIFYVVEEYNK